MASKVTKRGGKGVNHCAQQNVLSPRAVPQPRKRRRPKERDMRAFLLQGQGKSQRQIAEELGCDQATVCRALERYRLWFGKSLPEDRGPTTAEDEFKVDIERHRIFLEHAQDLALTAYHRSCQTLPITKKREKVYPEGRKAAGDPVTETQTDKCDKVQYGHIASLNAAVRYSHERLVLASGHIGPGNGCISLAEVMDPDERDRWDRLVTNRDARIEELSAALAAEKLARKKLQAEAQAAQALPTASPGKTASDCITSSSEMHHDNSAEIAANPAAEIVCAEPVEPAEQSLSPHSEIPQVHHNAGRHSETGPEEARQSFGEARSQAVPRKEERDVPPAPKYRWEDQYRQEALDFHCLKFGLPPASLEQATGIPDPFKISPRMWIEKGLPYAIYIDRTIPCDRVNPLDTRQVMRLDGPIRGWG